MPNKEKNITIVNSEDRNFIQVLMSLPPEKKFFVKGIILGMEAQERIDTTLELDGNTS
ncbi:MAG: hypothetical protein HFH68_06970 [Lachnospiraceae bacterium]|nr:hypothetical protein [Lachnospiraceae bacterium]